MKKTRDRGCTVKVHLPPRDVRHIDRLCVRFWPSLPPASTRATAILMVLRNYWDRAEVELNR